MSATRNRPQGACSSAKVAKVLSGSRLKSSTIQTVIGGRNPIWHEPAYNSHARGTHEGFSPGMGGDMAIACPVDLDTSTLRSEISNIYGRVAMEPAAEYHFHRGPRYAAEFLGYET